MSKTENFRVSPLNDPDTTYFVECDYGRLGFAFRETESSLTDGKLVELIENGDIDTPIVRILAVNPKAGTCLDVTEQIGALVFYSADSMNEGFGRLGDVATKLCERAGFDLDAEHEAWEAVNERETREWERQLASTAPCRAVNL